MRKIAELTIPISIRADKVLYERVRLAAYEGHCSMGELIRRVLREKFNLPSPVLDSEGGNNVEATVSGS